MDGYDQVLHISMGSHHPSILAIGKFLLHIMVSRPGARFASPIDVGHIVKVPFRHCSEALVIVLGRLVNQCHNDNNICSRGFVSGSSGST